MTTRTKLNAALSTSSVMMLLNVFSEPLGISGDVKWALVVGVFVPLGLFFYYSKKMKLEASRPASNMPAGSELSVERKKMRKRLIVIWGCVVVYSLMAPVWLPITGVSLGVRGDIFVGVLVAALISAIFAVRLKKTAEPTGPDR